MFDNTDQAKTLASKSVAPVVHFSKPPAVALEQLSLGGADGLCDLLGVPGAPLLVCLSTQSVPGCTHIAMPTDAC